jgi:hypothetical protein
LNAQWELFALIEGMAHLLLILASPYQPTMRPDKLAQQFAKTLLIGNLIAVPIISVWKTPFAIQ